MKYHKLPDDLCVEDKKNLHPYSELEIRRFDSPGEARNYAGMAPVGPTHHLLVCESRPPLAKRQNMIVFILEATFEFLAHAIPLATAAVMLILGCALLWLLFHALSCVVP